MPKSPLEFASLPEISAPATLGTFGYRMSNMRHGSEHYGVCEVCKQNCETTFYQVELRCYQVTANGPSWTYSGTRNSLFGHRDCLLSQRRTPTPP